MPDMLLVICQCVAFDQFSTTVLHGVCAHWNVLFTVPAETKLLVRPFGGVEKPNNRSNIVVLRGFCVVTPIFLL